MTSQSGFEVGPRPPEDSPLPQWQSPPLPPLPRIPRAPLARMLADYNPFYLLSAACMLFGVFAVNGSLDWSPIGLRRLLTMIVTLNVYEALLIALATFLLKRGIRRDALLLLIVEAFFLADVGFLNMEVLATHASVGLVVNALLLAAAVAKVALVFRAVGIPVADARFVFVALQLAVLFTVPGLFAVVAHGREQFLPPLAVYAGWWLAGALPVAYVMTVGSIDVFRKPFDGRPAGPDVVVSRVLLALPMVSLLAHLCLANWVYEVWFHPLNLGPLLLGLAVMAGHADAHVVTLARRMRLQLVLPFVAIALSAIKFPPDMVFDDVLGAVLTPLRLTLLVAALVYLDGLWLHRHPNFAWAAGMCLACAGMGHSVGTINDNSVRMARTSSSVFERLIPKTLAAWGVISIVASFLLLAIGAAISVFVKRPAPVVEAAGEEAGNRDGNGDIT